MRLSSAIAATLCAALLLPVPSFAARPKKGRKAAKVVVQPGAPAAAPAPTAPAPAAPVPATPLAGSDTGNDTAKDAGKDAAKAAPAAPTNAGKAGTSKSSPDALALSAKIAAFYAATEGMTANFTQVVRKKGLKKGINRKGQVWLKKGKVLAEKDADGKPKVENGRMRWDYPDEEVFYFSDGEILWTYERRERVALRLPVKDSRLYQATGYLLGQGDLAADFDLAVVKSPVADTLALDMVPKEGAAVMQKLTLIVDAKTGAVVASILIDPLGDSTSLFFKDLTYGPLEDKTFAWKPPAGVTIRTP